jgi:hypothetical protein
MLSLPSFLTGRSPESQPPLADTGNAYRQAMLFYRMAGSEVDHRFVVGELLAEMHDCIPFPNHLLSGRPSYEITPKIIEVAPHEFELVRLIDKLNWITRLALIKGGGSATKEPELFASRGISSLKVDFIRWVHDEDVDRSQTPIAVMQSGNCGDSADFTYALARTLDDDMFSLLGIDPQELCWNRLELFRLHACHIDHEYAVCGYGAFETRQVEVEGTGEQRDFFQEDLDQSRLWTMDSHQLYPAPCRYDESLFNDSYIAPRDTNRHLDLGEAREIRARMTRELELGQDGISQALRDRYLAEVNIRSIRSEYIDEVKRRQDVDHHARVDTTLLSPAERQKFKQIVEKIEHEQDRKIIKRMYRLGWFANDWKGVFVAKNPAVGYRNSKTGDLVRPHVPAHYFERTERIRWAYAVWERTRPRREALQARSGLLRPKFEIHPSVEAIENMPFFHALAPARAMNLESNEFRNEDRIHAMDELQNAFTALEDWIGRMHGELNADPSLVRTIESLGLGEDVRQALNSVRHNLHAFHNVMCAIVDGLSKHSQDRQPAVKLQEEALGSPAWQQTSELQQAFGVV